MDVVCTMSLEGNEEFSEDCKESGNDEEFSEDELRNQDC